MMKRYLVVAVFAMVFTVTGSARADENFGAHLGGFSEVPIISSDGKGYLLLTLNNAGNTLTYQLVYFGLSSNVTQAHIHGGQVGVNGAIVLFFCTNLALPVGVPAPPPCPNNPGVNFVVGVLTSLNVLAQTNQGFAAGDLSAVLRAIRAGVSYANVHTTIFPGGEIRGQVRYSGDN